MTEWTLSVLVCVLQVRSDRDKFIVYLDVKHFAPDDLSVKITEDYVEIKGKHGERQVELLSFTHNTLKHLVRLLDGALWSVSADCRFYSFISLQIGT